MATDPDADRFGTAFPDKNGKFVLLSGNQMGGLLMEYVLLSRTELGTMPEKPVVVRSIVTSPFGDAVCRKYNVKMVECLTGFKWIAAAEADMEADHSGEYVFGLEESYGYKIEKEVFDKDGVSAAAMCAEMTLYWRSRGKSLLEHLDDMYKEYGYFEDRSISQYFPGPTGGKTMAGIMTKLRDEGLKTLGGKRVTMIRDVERSVTFDPADPKDVKKISLPKSNVLQFFLEGGTIVSARPSGTEPKIKFYINTDIPVAGHSDAGLAAARKEAAALCDAISSEIKATLDAAAE
jgi:phosphoglucomutase